MRGEIDSEQYAIALALRSPQEIPADFKLSILPDAFLAGLFLPRDPPDWFGRSAYPARVLTLAADRVFLYAHPRSGQPSTQIPLAELSILELGRFLLQGWIRFITSDADQTVGYNTTNQPIVEAFVKRVRGQWLRSASQINAGLATEIDDLKFLNSFLQEIGPDEQICSTLFQPPVVQRRRWWRPYSVREPGDLVALTTKRLLWITDRYQGRSDKYGTLTSYAPIARITAARLEHCASESRLRIEFDAAHVWRVPLPVERSDDAQKFISEVRRSIACKSSPAYRSTG